MAPPDLVFMWCDECSEGPSCEECDTEFTRRAKAVFPDARFRAGGGLMAGRAVYIAHSPAHLATYEGWYPGLTVRAHARLRHKPLQPGEAMYLPVTFDSWVVLVDGLPGLGAALEAASLLKDVRVVACPAFDLDRLADVERSLATRRYTRWQDRVMPQLSQLPQLPQLPQTDPARR